MRIKMFVPATLLVVLIGVYAFSFSDVSQKNKMAPQLIGTYKLIERQLPDGTIQTAPEVMGLLTFTKKHRNLNLVWKDAGGKFLSYSLASTYKLTANEYTETVLFSVLNGSTQIEQAQKEMIGETRTVPVIIKDNKLTFNLPFDQHAVAFDENWITITAQGRFTDYWERVD